MIKEKIEEYWGYDLNNDELRQLLEFGSESEVLKVTEAHKNKKDVYNPVGFIRSILEGKSQRKSAKNEGLELTFKHIYDPLLEQGVVTQEEYNLIHGAWNGRRIEDEEKRHEINFKAHRHMYKDKPQAWFPHFDAAQKREAEAVYRTALEHGEDVTYETFANITGDAYRRQYKEGMSLEGIIASLGKPMKQATDDLPF